MIYDIIIIGSGPAGLTAAIYARRANKDVLVLEKNTMGGNITHSPKVENYPGYDSISGLELADKFTYQAMNLGVVFDFDEVIGIEKGTSFIVKGKRKNFEGKAVIIATGSKHRQLKLENENNLVGHGISYCAVCDGAFYANHDVTLIGGGNSAMQEAILLSKTCTSVTMIQNLPFLTGESALACQINKTDNIKVIYNKVVVKLNGENSLSSIVLEDNETKEQTLYNTDSVFVAIGQEADNLPFADVCELDEQGFIISNDFCETKTRGIYVAGDCKRKAVRQIVTATSDGSIAALQAIRYLDTLE